MASTVPNQFSDSSGTSDNVLSGYDRARVGGSGFTVFAWQNKPILYARQISHQSPQPVGPGTVEIHPMDTPYPVELITPQAAGMGTLTVEFYELYGSNVWERLNGLSGTDGVGPVDLVGIFKTVAESASPIRIFKYIKPPNRPGAGAGSSPISAYTEEYNNCVVSQLVDGETIEVGTMEVLKQMVINYTHVTRGGNNDLLASTKNLGGVDATSVNQTRYR